MKPLQLITIIKKLVLLVIFHCDKHVKFNIRRFVSFLV